MQWVLSPKYFNFPLPISLTMIHMGFSGAVAFFLVRVFKVCYAIFCVVLYFGNMLLFPDLWSILIWLPLIFNVAWPQSCWIQWMLLCSLLEFRLWSWLHLGTSVMFSLLQCYVTFNYSFFSFFLVGWISMMWFFKHFFTCIYSRWCQCSLSLGCGPSLHLHKPSSVLDWAFTAFNRCFQWFDHFYNLAIWMVLPTYLNLYSFSLYCRLSLLLKWHLKCECLWVEAFLSLLSFDQLIS